MGPLAFFQPVLRALDDGKVVRMAVALALNVLGGFLLLGGIYLLVEMLKWSFRLPTEGTIGGLIMAILVAAAILAVVQVLFHRAGNIRALGVSAFTVIPICSILFRAVGEVYATLGVAVGVGGCIFIWLAGRNPLFLLGGLGGMYPGVGADTGFLGGLLFLFWVALLAFTGLIAFYFLAESTVVLVDIAKNIRLLVRDSTEVARDS